MEEFFNTSFKFFNDLSTYPLFRLLISFVLSAFTFILLLFITKLLNRIIKNDLLYKILKIISIILSVLVFVSLTFFYIFQIDLKALENFFKNDVIKILLIILIPILNFLILQVIHGIFKKKFRIVEKISPTLKLIIIIISLLIFSNLVGNYLTEIKIIPDYTIFTIINLIIGFFLILFLLKLIDYFLVDIFLIQVKKVTIPKIIHDLSRVLIGIFLFIILIVILYKEALTFFGLSTAAITAGVAFAAQETLANLFAGLSINLSKPFKVGEWISLSETEFGEISQISWRATTLKTLDNNYIIIPNKIVANAQIINYSSPSRITGRNLIIDLDLNHPPNLVKKVLLKVLKDSEEIADFPEPLIWINQYGEYFVQYKMRYWITKFERFPFIEDEIYSKVWYALNRNSIVIPYPINNVYVKRQSRKENQSDLDILKNKIVKIDLFQDIDEKYISGLINEIDYQFYGVGEYVIKTGEEANDLFIVEQGEIAIERYVNSQKKINVEIVYPGSFFGEMSLLTGKKRSADCKALQDTYLFKISKPTLA